MSDDKVSKFCDSVHTSLEALEGRINSLKVNIGTTWHFLREKLDDARLQGGAPKRGVTEARTKLKEWFEEQKIESTSKIDQLVKNRETQTLAARARESEDCAAAALMIAEASIEDVERLVLEAIAARRDAEAVTVG